MARAGGFAKASHDGARAYDGRMDALPARLHLDEVIARKPSLGRAGFAVLIGVVMVVNIGVGIMFVRMGAAPVPIFLGLDVLAIWLAFRASYRQAQRSERVRISADLVEVIREDAGGAETVWSTPTAFTRVALEPRGRYAPEVRIRLSRRVVTVGQALGPRQRSDLAEAIDAAIRSARLERHAS
jgi:uncharacterized membrane protein